MSDKDDLHHLIDELPEADLVALRQLQLTPRLPECLALPTLIARQGFRPLRDPLALAEGGWPEDEPVDDLLAAREAWRRTGEDG